MTSKNNNGTVNYLVFLTTGLQLHEIPVAMQKEATQDAYDLFMAYVDDYFAAKGLTKEAIRLKYAKQTNQQVLTTMPGFAEKVGDALISYTQFCGYAI